MEYEGITFDALRDLIKRLIIKGQLHEYVRVDEFLSIIERLEKEQVEKKNS